MRDSLGFDEIVRWAVGRRHDHRPVLRLEHAPHTRIERIPAHRVLWFRWGDARGPVVHRETTLPFNRDRDPEFRAIVDRLRADGVPEDELLEIMLPRTREERLGDRVTLGVQTQVRRAGTTTPEGGSAHGRISSTAATTSRGRSGWPAG